MSIRALPLVALLGAVLSAAPPTIFVAGDPPSGGDPLAPFFDPAKVTIADRTRAGSGTQAAWQSLLDDAKQGDFVLLQFAPDDEEPLDAGGPLPGIGDDTRESAVVHTHG